MRSAAIILTVSLLFISCSKYNIKSELKDKAKLSNFKHSGIIIRVPDYSSLNNELHNKTLSFWLDGYKKVNKLHLLSNASANLSAFHTEYERMYKLSGKNDFLKYKTLGAIYQYVRKNEVELDKIMSQNDLDSLILYEVDSTYSLEMQYYQFNSMIVILDSSYDVAYIDHQNMSKDIFEIDRQIIRKTLLDDINTRFSELMFGLNYLDKRSRKEIRDMMPAKKYSDTAVDTEKETDEIPAPEDEKEPVSTEENGKQPVETEKKEETTGETKGAEKKDNSAKSEETPAIETKKEDSEPEGSKKPGKDQDTPITKEKKEGTQTEKPATPETVKDASDDDSEKKPGEPVVEK